MKKTIKNILLFIILVIAFIINKNNVFALSANIQITSDKTTFDINDIVNVNITVSSDDSKLGSYQFDVINDDRLSLVEGEKKVVEVGDGLITTKTYLFKYKALSSGTSTIKVENIRVLDWDTENEMSLINSNPNLKININEPPKSLINIDSPTANSTVTGNLTVLGWVMSTLKDKNIELYLDNKKIDDVTFSEREDVINAINGYGGKEENPTPGFKYVVDSKTLKSGNHTLIIKIINSNNNSTICEKSINFKTKTYNTHIQLDGPKNEIFSKKKINIVGWVMSEYANKKVEVYIDNKMVEDITFNAREDVIKAISGYGGKEENPTPGFSKTLSAKDYSVGNHIILIKVINKDNNEVLSSTQDSFVIKELKTIINIDSPSQLVSTNSNVKVVGWAMSNYSNKKVEIYIDDKNIDNVTFSAREDVIKAVNGYGGKEENPTPGFSATYDSNLLSGTSHKVIVRIIDKEDNEVLDESIKYFSTEKPKTIINIDSPSNTIARNSTIKIQGWTMSTLKEKNVEIYIDDKKIENVTFSAREDVIKAVNGYGNSEQNPTPGFSATYDSNLLTSGTHKVIVKVIDSVSNEVIEKSTKSFTIEKPKTIINIDSPSKTISKNSIVKIFGWTMSTLKEKNVEIYIDDKKIENVTFSAREDVIKAVNGYGNSEQNPTPGFSATYDSNLLTSGTHKVIVKVIDSVSNEVIEQSTKSFTIEKPKTIINIDSPSSTIKRNSTIKIQGWTMSTLKEKNVEIYIDDKKIENVTFSAREDVIKAVNGYGNSEQNPTPGFSATYDSNLLTSGTHKVIVKVIDKNNNEVLEQSVKDIKIDKYVGIINLDNPNSTSLYKNNIKILGWFLSDCKNKRVDIYIDDVKVDNITYVARDDILKVINGYGNSEQNPTPGINANYNIENFKDGKHSIKINIVDVNTDEIISTDTKTFKVQKYYGFINLDSPSGSNFSSDFNVIGWEMSELDNSYIKVFVDGKELSNPISRYQRDDVISAIKDYGDSSVNSTPGFSSTVSISEYNEGFHDLTVKLYTKLNEEIYSVNKRIFISKSLSYGIDISEYQTVYNWNLVKNFGIDYAIIRAVYRGYGAAGTLHEDSKFFSHVQGATSAGIKVGAYVYSQAINANEAQTEANLAIQMVNLAGGKNKFTMPIVFDTEFTSCVQNGNRCGRADNLSREQRTQVAIAFLETVKNAGYTPMIYASSSFLNNQLDMSKLSSYQVWVANYDVPAPYYNGPYQIWQYRSDGSVSGIYGNIDMDYVYLRY